MSKIIGILLPLFIFFSFRPFPCFSANNEICKEAKNGVCEESLLDVLFSGKKDEKISANLIYVAKRYVISPERSGDDPLCDEFYSLSQEE